MAGKNFFFDNQIVHLVECLLIGENTVHIDISSVNMIIAVKLLPVVLLPVLDETGFHANARDVNVPITEYSISIICWYFRKNI